MMAPRKMHKKGFALEMIFSALGYFLCVFVIVVLLNISGCILNKEAVSSSVSCRADTAASLRAEVQLAAYMRTQIPSSTELFAKLDWLKGKHDKEFAFANGFDPEAAVKFLDKHPEVYSGKDYAGFIRSIYAYYLETGDKDGVKSTFNAVTAVLFFRSKGDKQIKDGHLYYLFPVGVDFCVLDLELCDLGYKVYDLCAGYLPQQLAYQGRTAVKAESWVPLADNRMARVELLYYPEFEAWLQGP